MLQAGLILLLGVLLIVDLIKCYTRLVQQIWSYSWLVRFRVAGRVVYSRENLPETETKSKGWILLVGDSLWTFGVSSCFVSRSTACLYSGLSF